MNDSHHSAYVPSIAKHRDQQCTVKWLLTRPVLLYFVLMLAPCVAASAEAEWGDLSGQFIYEGKPPVPKRLPIDKDAAIFGNGVKDNSLLVNNENQGVANVIVYLLPERGQELRVHPAYADEADAAIDLAVSDGQYSPRVLLARTTQTIVEPSYEEVRPNTYIQTIQNPASGRLVAGGQPVEHRFSFEEPMPIPINCSIHSWMRAFLLVRSNPYMAKSTEDGNFEIKNLPVGRHAFRVWHERVGFLRDVKLGPGAHAIDSHGRMTLEIVPGENDLGKAVLPSKLFEVVSQREQQKDQRD